MHVVTVTFELFDEHVEAFAKAIKIQAENSLALEPGCHRFDVCQAPEEGNRIFLYEIYSDEGAFQTHQQSSHYHSFNLKIEKWVASKSVEIWKLEI